MVPGRPERIGDAVGEQATLELTPQELRLRWAMRLFAVLFLSETVLYLAPAFVGSARPPWVQLPFVANSFVKSFLFGGLCAIAAADVRRFEHVVSLIVADVCVWIVIAIPILIFGRTDPVHEVLGFDVSITAIMSGGDRAPGRPGDPVRAASPQRVSVPLRDPLPDGGPV